MHLDRRSLPILASVIVATVLLAGYAVGERAPDESSRVKGWLGDLDTLVATVRRVHWHYRDAPLPPEFELQRRTFRERIKDWSDSRAVVELQRLLATLNDGHTVVYPFGMRQGRLAHLPVALYDFDDGLAVIAADPAHRDLIGRRVVSIGGVPSEQVLDRLHGLASSENRGQLRWVLPTYVTFPEYLRAAGIQVEDAGVIFTIAAAGKVQSVTIAAGTGEIDPANIVTGLVPPPLDVGATVPLALSRLGEPYWSALLPPDDSVVYVQLNRVASVDSDPLEAFAQGLLGLLDRPSTSRLVIDLRYDSGGNAAVLPPLLRTIIAFRVRRPAAPIDVLIGRQTFSAAQTLVNRLEEYVSPVFVGEETGSKPNRFGNESSFTLPFSGVIGGISSGYNQAASSRDTRTATRPDVAVGMTLADWLAGRDPALDAATQRD
jgi:hypothetical protein